MRYIPILLTFLFITSPTHASMRVDENKLIQIRQDLIDSSVRNISSARFIYTHTFTQRPPENAEQLFQDEFGKRHLKLINHIRGISTGKYIESKLAFLRKQNLSYEQALANPVYKKKIDAYMKPRVQGLVKELEYQYTENITTKDITLTLIPNTHAYKQSIITSKTANAKPTGHTGVQAFYAISPNSPRKQFSIQSGSIHGVIYADNSFHLITTRPAPLTAGSYSSLKHFSMFKSIHASSTTIDNQPANILTIAQTHKGKTYTIIQITYLPDLNNAITKIDFYQLSGIPNQHTRTEFTDFRPTSIGQYPFHHKQTKSKFTLTKELQDKINANPLALFLPENQAAIESHITTIDENAIKQVFFNIDTSDTDFNLPFPSGTSVTEFLKHDPNTGRSEHKNYTTP
ncbi:hypothetical protein [Poriferisphaera sp. WC338]|uniref:hypothetical protein n=1 Tax=Poriferisphaera sp. WC338 TaxID=3425129 RepID=UPI003D81B0BC